MTASYATTEELAELLGVKGNVPDISIIGSARSSETVFAGGTTITSPQYLDNPCVILNTYTLSYGASEGSGTALTEGTHFTLDRDLGKITITATGITTIGTNLLFGKYSYVKVQIPDTELQKELNNAEEDFNDQTNNLFVDSGTATPAYAQVTNEKHDGKGKFDTAYYLDHFPLPDVSTNLSSAVAVGGTVLPVSSTDGFLSSGVVLIDNEKFTYTAKTSTSFTGVTASAAHSSGGTVVPYVIEISGTDPGTDPSWTVLTKDSDFDIDLQTGRVTLYRSDFILATLSLSYPQEHVPNRFRATYIYGNDSIPPDVKHTTLLMAAKSLLKRIVRKAMMDGKNDFKPELIGVDDEEIKNGIDQHRNYHVRNV